MFLSLILQKKIFIYTYKYLNTYKGTKVQNSKITYKYVSMYVSISSACCQNCGQGFFVVVNADRSIGFSFRTQKNNIFLWGKFHFNNNYHVSMIGSEINDELLMLSLTFNVEIRNF